METFYRFFALVRADVLERMRSSAFWLVLGLTTGLMLLSFPSQDAGYVVMKVNGNFRGVYSSAWIGMVVAMLSVWLSLLGFFVVRGTLRRDIEGRVYELLAVTSASRASFLLAKWTSHMLLLGLIVSAQLAVGVGMQFWRGEDTSLHLLELLKPSILIGLPSLSLVAALAIAFDLIPWLRRTAGNVLYVALWIALLIYGISRATTGPLTDFQFDFPGDPRGLTVFASAVKSHPNAMRAGQGSLSVCMVCGTKPAGAMMNRFDWSDWQVTPVQMAGRAFWLAFSLTSVLLLSLVLDRAAAGGVHAGGGTSRSAGTSGLRLTWLTRLLNPLAKAAWGQMLAAELLLTLRQQGLWWWFALLVTMNLQVFAPPSLAAKAVIVAWILLLGVFSKTALRDQECHSAPIVFTAPGATASVRRSRWLLVLVLAGLMTLPALLRFSFTSPTAALALLLAGASLASWGLALSCLTRSSRPFELLACSFAYFGIQGMPVLNVVVDPGWTVLLHSIALPIAVIVYWMAWPKLYRTIA